MKKNKLFLIAFFFQYSFIYSTGWMRVGDGVNYPCQTLFVDSTDDKLYLGGSFSASGTHYRLNGLAYWNGQSWDSVGDRSNIISQYNFAIAKFQNQLYTDGRPAHQNSNSGIRLNGTNWDSLGRGVDGSIYQYKEHNGQLLVGGFFNEVDGYTCWMLASWDGSNWSCMDVPYTNQLQDFTFYNNELILAGNFFDSTGNNIDLAAFDGVSYHVLGHPIYGLANNIAALIIYHGELYIGGYFESAAGNEGHCIMRWDGTQWRDVGGGTDSRVDCFMIYNDELYVGGVFEYAGGIRTGNLAKWNGSSWSQVTPSIISGVISDMAVYHDELYIAGAIFSIDSIPINHVAKFTGPLGINDEKEILSLSLSPNPASEKITLQCKASMSQVKVFNVVGSMHNVINPDYSADKKTATIDVSELPPGVYFISAKTVAGMVVERFIKN